MLSLVLLLLLSLLFFLLLVTAPLAAAIGIGWVLMQFLPFTLFEGSLLGFIALIVAAPLAARFFRFMTKPDIDANNLSRSLLDDLLEDEWEEQRYEEEETEMLIPAERFFRGAPTWEQWLEHHFANEIYEAFIQNPTQLKPMNERQQQELAIRLAEVAIQVLKKKPPSTRRLRITREQLEQTLHKQGQQPYDGDIMDLATDALAETLHLYEEEIIYIIRSKAWTQPTDIL
ncbi:MAG: hypothetical protein GXP42_15620 [Chloroflexi bacterium]|nr:hypothetical protein [Chloroflexota bacterium]